MEEASKPNQKLVAPKNLSMPKDKSSSSGSKKKKKIKNSQKNLLHFAITHNQATACCAILLEGGSDPNETDNQGETPLHIAASNGRVDVISLLIESKGDPTIFNHRGETPFHNTVTYIQPEAFEWFLDYGIKTALCTADGKNILHLATMANFPLELLSELFTDLSPFVVEDMLNKKTIDKEWTPLHSACSYGSMDVLALFINEGADVRKITKDGATPSSLLLNRISKEKKDISHPDIYQKTLSCLHLLGVEQFSKKHVERALTIENPAISLQGCELDDPKFIHLLLRMFGTDMNRAGAAMGNINIFSHSDFGGVGPYLTYLDISHNSISTLPREIKQLKQLQWLNISNNHLVSLPLTLGLLKNLKYLNISNNELTKLPPSFAEFRNHKTRKIVLSQLEWSGNEIETPPKAIMKAGIEPIIDYFANALDGEDEMSNNVILLCVGARGSGKSSLIRSLSSRNRVKFLSRLSSKSNFQKDLIRQTQAVETFTFELSGSVSRALSDTGVDPIELAEENIRRAHLDTVVINIQVVWENFKKNGIFYETSKASHSKSFPRYFLASEFIDWLQRNASASSSPLSKKTACSVASLLEKSQLIRHLERPKQRISDKKEPFILCEEEMADFSFHYKALDFDGSVIQSSLPLLFFPAATVILVLWDIREKPKHSDVPKWLDLITSHSENIAIIIVATHSDEKDENSIVSALKQMNYLVCDKYPIQCMIAVSTTSRDGIPILGHHIFTETVKIQAKARKVPAKFAQFQQAIHEEIKNCEEPIMYLKEFEEIGSLFSLHEHRLREAANFLLKTGTFFYQPSKLILSERHGGLVFKSFFCFSALWLGNLILRILQLGPQKHKHGVLDQKSLEVIWGVPTFLSNSLIDLFTSIDFLFPVPYSFRSFHNESREEVLEAIASIAAKRAVAAAKPRRLRRLSGSHNVFAEIKQLMPKYFAPSVLSGTYDKQLLIDLWPESNSYPPLWLEYARSWKFSFIIDALWHRLFAQVLVAADVAPIYWNHGVLVIKGNVVALLEMRERQNMIILRVRGSGNRRSTIERDETFALFRNILDIINSLTQFWFESSTKEIEIRVPCPHCIAHCIDVSPAARPKYHITAIHNFSLGTCSKEITEHKRYIGCPRLYKGTEISSFVPKPTRKTLTSSKDNQLVVPSNRRKANRQSLRADRKNSKTILSKRWSQAPSSPRNRVSANDLDLDVQSTSFSILGYEKAHSEDSNDQIRIPIDILVPDLLLVDLHRVRVPASAIVLGEKLGAGAYGDVYKGIYDGKEYAVKTLQAQENSNMDEFCREVALMSKLQHPTLVHLICYCNDPFMIVLELMKHGELYDFLHNESLYGPNLDWKMRTQIVIDIAKGISFLHANTPPVIHRDLKSPNVLLTHLSSTDSLDIPVAKVADFGLSTSLFQKKVKQSSRNRDVQIPTWLAPEVLQAQPYGEKSDCYALGIIMWELIAPGQHPFDEFDFGGFNVAQEEAITSGTRPSIPEEYMVYSKYFLDQDEPEMVPKKGDPLDLLKIEYLRIMTSCWHQRPEKRPSFITLYFRLSKRFLACFEQNSHSISSTTVHRPSTTV